MPPPLVSPRAEGVGTPGAPPPLASPRALGTVTVSLTSPGQALQHSPSMLAMSRSMSAKVPCSSPPVVQSRLQKSNSCRGSLERSASACAPPGTPRTAGGLPRSSSTLSRMAHRRAAELAPSATVLIRQRSPSSTVQLSERSATPAGQRSATPLGQRSATPSGHQRSATPVGQRTASRTVVRSMPVQQGEGSGSIPVVKCVPVSTRVEAVSYKPPADAAMYKPLPLVTAKPSQHESLASIASVVVPAQQQRMACVASVVVPSHTETVTCVTSVPAASPTKSAPPPSHVVPAPRFKGLNEDSQPTLAWPPGAAAEAASPSPALSASQTLKALLPVASPRSCSTQRSKSRREVTVQATSSRQSTKAQRVYSELSSVRTSRLARGGC